MPRLLGGANFAGAGMQERLRTATFALFGLVTAVGLGLVGVAYNQGWPAFTDSPIPGVPTERVGEATIAAHAAHGNAPGRGPASRRHAQAGRTDFVEGRSPGHDSASHPQLPVTEPAGHAPGPSSSGPGGVHAPEPPAPAPVPQATQPPASAGQQPGQAAAPVATSPPASQTAASASVPGKAKGHEKAEKPHGKPAEKSHGKPARVTPVVPLPPSVPAPGPATPESPPAGGPGNGHGNANGHDR